MQARWRLPRAIADSTNRLWDAAAIRENHVSVANRARHFHLQTLHGGIDVARGASAGRFLAQYVPWFQGIA